MKRINKKNHAMLKIESKEGVLLEEILRRMYVDENKNIMQIAKELSTAYSTIVKWLRLAGVYSHRLNL